MVKFIVVRILQAIPTLFIIATLTFFMTRLAPGGPFDSEKNIPAEIKEKLEAHFGLEKPLYEQYFLYLSNLLQGDLGPSFKYMGWEVSELIAKAFPVSAQLGLFSLLIALVLGLPAGVLAALRKNSVYDYCLMTTAMLGICLPTFVMVPLLILLFSSWLGWLPPLGLVFLCGYDSAFPDPWSFLWCLHCETYTSRHAGNSQPRLHPHSPGKRCFPHSGSLAACDKRGTAPSSDFSRSGFCRTYQWLIHY